MTETGQTNGETPIETSELNKLWQTYLQKCCEVGQLEHSLEQLEGQKREIEKRLEVTKRQVKSTAHKHKELHQVQLSKTKVPSPTPEIQEQAAH